MQEAIRAAKDGDWSETGGVITAGGIDLEPGEYELVLETSGRPGGEALAVLPGGGFVLLDTETTPELEAEGLARDVVRAIQDTRKAAGFDVSDRIALRLTFSDEADAAAVVSAFEAASVAGETLALAFAVLGATTLLSEGSMPAEFAHTGTFAAGAFANAGAFTVDVARIEARA